ncbi:MAG TPA: alginate lyase family protein [Candidatus Hydrogenedentes bacterium]|nr:alginate lyase family protein [Candidatus Hydrogenedentota bacterium]
MLHLLAFLALAVASDTVDFGRVGQGVMDVETLVQVNTAVEILAKAEFDFPEAAQRLWEVNDGLPQPDDKRFAPEAIQFMMSTPQPPPEYAGPSPWQAGLVGSRQCKCLAYLATGPEKARKDVARLCVVQALRLEWLLPVSTSEQDRGFFAAVGSLGFTGGVIYQHSEMGTVLHEMSAQAVRTATRLLAPWSEGTGDAYCQAAQALLEAAPVPEAVLAPSHELDVFFDQINLEHPDMARVARHIKLRNARAAKATYIVALSGRFGQREDWPDVRPDRTVNVAEADDLCRNVFALRSDGYTRQDFGKEVDWTFLAEGDPTGCACLNAHRWANVLLNAYKATHDEKYAYHLSRLFLSWKDSSPVPCGRSEAPWSLPETGSRAGQIFPSILMGLADHPRFERDGLFPMAQSMLEHGRYLMTHASQDGAALQIEASGLATIALMFPEFKLAKSFYRAALNRLARANALAFLPDGMHVSCSPMHQVNVIKAIGAMHALATATSWPIPDSVTASYLSALGALAYLTYPNQHLPLFNDAGPFPPTVHGIFDVALHVAERDAFAWFASGGTQGKPPLRCSHDFPDAGYCVMRDEWRPDGSVFLFDAGRLGAERPHEDKLSFTFFAGGRELIGDAGFYACGYDAWAPYWWGSWSHNVILVDGLGQHRALDGEEIVPDPDRRFIIGDGFDFAEGWYRGPYSSRAAQVRRSVRNAGENEPLRGIAHQRCVLFIDGAYVVVCDRVLGVDCHTLELLFHLAPVVNDDATGEDGRPHVRAVSLDIEDDGAVITREEDVANVAILPAQSDGIEVTSHIGTQSPVRGWYSLYGRLPSPEVVYTCRTQLPKTFQTVIQPLPPGSDTVPMAARAVEVECPDSQACAGLRCGDDLFLLSYTGTAEITCEDVRFAGTALLIRRNASGRATLAHMVDGKRLELAGKKCTPSRSPFPVSR